MVKLKDEEQTLIFQSFKHIRIKKGEEEDERQQFIFFIQRRHDLYIYHTCLHTFHTFHFNTHHFNPFPSTPYTPFLPSLLTCPLPSPLHLSLTWANNTPALSATARQWRDEEEREGGRKEEGRGKKGWALGA